MNEMQNYAPNEGMAPKTVSTEMMISRQAQEVQAAMVVAKRFPRNEVESHNRIRYMAERIDFAVRGMNRNISSAGVSSLVLYNALVELSGSLSSMRGTLNQLSGSVTETQEAVTALGDRVTALENQNGG